MARRRGGDKIFQRNKEKEKSDFKRATNNRMKRKDIIIACEDSVSSPTYFKMMSHLQIQHHKVANVKKFVRNN